MAKFIYEDDLNAGLSRIIKEANEFLLIVSPFIKLHPRTKSLLEEKKQQPQVEITVVFGKNEDNMEKSMSREDLEYLKGFPNIAILHESRLHAKYYANEKSALLTSMNLYDYSQNNNIEFGVLMESSKLSNLGKSLVGGQSLEDDALAYFVLTVINQAWPIFVAEAEFKDGFLGMSSKYLGSKIAIDQTNDFFNNKAIRKGTNYKPRWQNRNAGHTNAQVSRPAFKASGQHTTGYCIRTGKPIPFNPKRPLSEEAYKMWSQYSNPDFKEKYCHFSGEPSNGETTFAKPILKKNWAMAKEAFGI